LCDRLASYGPSLKIIVDFQNILADLYTDAEPPLSPPEQEVVNAYGSWTQFMMSFGLKPWETEDAEEGKRIAETFAAHDDSDEESEE